MVACALAAQTEERPQRASEPPLIEHVVYTIKENRTYDQAPSDLERGNGNPSLMALAWTAAPSDRLNRILWRHVRGFEPPYPGVRRAAFAPLSLDLEDDER